MKSKHNENKKLIKKWTALEKKKVRLQDYVLGKNMELSLAPEERKKLRNIKRKLKEKCLEFLSAEERYQVN